MTSRNRTISVVLSTADPNDHALITALLSQAGAVAPVLVPGPADFDALAACLDGRPDPVCLLDERLCEPGDLLSRIVATGRPVIVVIDAEDLPTERRRLAAGAWDCLARSSLTPSALVKSVCRAVDHARQLRTTTGAQAALAASELRFRSLVRNAVHGILHTMRDGTIAEANPAVAAMLGLDSETDLLNRNILEFYQDPQDRERVLGSLQESGRVAPIEVQWRRRDGSLFWVRLSGRAVVMDDGAVAGFEVLAEDVTEHRTLESQFRQAQKMEALGRLAGGVAHDFNNLLTAMIGYAEILRDQIETGDHRRNQVEEICKAAERGSALTRQLLTFSRKPVSTPQTLDLNAVVRGFERMLRRLIGEHIKLATTTADDLGFVRANPGQVEQVLMNLAINGRDAMSGGGRLTIETANVELSAIYSRTHAAVAPGAYVMLAVSDTGCGMTAEVKAHLFEPFFTTKESGKGSGLGLATVYGIVQQSGGHIFVYSEPGKGSTFKIYLPRVERGETADCQVAADRPVTSGTETVLLVEDEPSVRTLARELLQAQGYRVLLANHGREGLAVAAAFPETIDLVVTDVVMPEMSGPDMVRHLWWTRPKLSVLYMSGYTDQTAVQLGLQEPWTTFLQKPFTPDGLAAAVRRALDGSGAARG
jgi:two-component system, cell cycle sensor histidine kinase and response regulator CckA